MEVGELRRLFFNRFGDLSPSRPVIPVQDSTTPQIHSAINSMKGLFLANPPPDEGSIFSLNCVRVGDTLEDYSDIHHLSLNELLTTWNSGEQIEEIISKVFKFLIEDCKQQATKIYVTHGPEIGDLDTDCIGILRQYLCEDNIISYTSKGSYWNMDDDGPCGPCLQFYYYDVLPEYESRTPIELIKLNHHEIPRIWTIVFVQVRLFAAGDCGREYLLKSIDRQAIQLGIEKLGIPESRYANLVRKSIRAMVELFPELTSSLERIQQIVQSEAHIYDITLAEIEFDEAQQQPPIRTKKTTGKAGKQLDDLKPPTTWYKTREINFWDHRTHIVHTDKTNKSCLAALCNALLLGGKISLGDNVSHISDGQLLCLLHRLLFGNGNMELQSSLERSKFQNQVLNVLADLSAIPSKAVELHVELQSINGFVHSPLISLFEYLRVPLYHGCIMDREDKELAPGGPRLTPQGLTSLRAELKEKEPCVLFWNGSFITASNLNGSVYLLLDDIRFVDKHTHVCWELLKELYRGGWFTDCSFTHVDLDPSYTILPLTRSEKKKWRNRRQGTEDRTADHAEALEGLHQVDISPPSTSKRLYKTSQINFLGRQLNIILQESNGPCALIAICNVLLLKGVISLEQNATEVDEDSLLNKLQQYLQQNKGGLPEMPSEAYNSMRELSSDLEVDVTFNRIDGFRELPQNILIRFLGISLYHAWLPDPDDDTLPTLSSYSYSTLQIAAAESMVPNVAQVRLFLDGSQLTDYGLRCLRNDLEENIPCIIFWHNHYSTVVKIESEIYALATAAHYIGTPVVWEKLGDKGDTEPMNSNFDSAIEDPCLKHLDLPGTMSDYTSLHELSGQMNSQFSIEGISSATVRCQAFNESNDSSSITNSGEYVMLLQNYVEVPGNNFSEVKELSSSDEPLVVADTTPVGRIIGDDLLNQILEAHNAARSWDGEFEKIFVRDGRRTKLSAWIDGVPHDISIEAKRLDFTSYGNDWKAYVAQVISHFEIQGVGYPAFFLPLIETLLEELDWKTLSAMKYAQFVEKVQTNLALKFSLVRGEFWSGIHRIRRNVRYGGPVIRKLLSEVVLINGEDWRQVIYESNHPLLRKVLRYTEEEEDEPQPVLEGANINEFGNFLPTVDSASQFPRQVNEHAKDDDEQMDMSFGSFAELDLLYSHYLELPLAKAHELLVTSVSHTERLFDWFSEVIDMLQRRERW